MCSWRGVLRRTETKKLDVPSALVKSPGNSFNQVSSPYISNGPPRTESNCFSHESCVANEEDESDSAKLRMTSRKDGVDPVVSALIRGMVTVGGLACAVKGIAAPDSTNL